MKRKDFLKRLSGAAAFMLLPLSKLAARKKTWLLQFHIRGFQYYQGPDLIRRMSPGDTLTIAREPGNKYDPQAIAILYRDRKIGFVPREKNEVISRLLDAGAAELKAEIIKVNKDATPWDAVYAGIYLEKETFHY